MPSEGPAAVASRDYGTSAGQFEKPGDSPPIPPGTDGGELGIEPGIGQLGIPRPVWTLQINLAATPVAEVAQSNSTASRNRSFTTGWRNPLDRVRAAAH